MAGAVTRWGGIGCQTKAKWHKPGRTLLCFLPLGFGIQVLPLAALTALARVSERRVNAESARRQQNTS